MARDKQLRGSYRSTANACARWPPNARARGGLYQGPGKVYRVRTMSTPSGSVTITWTPPSVGPGQRPLFQFYVWQNDVLAGTQSYLGAVPADGTNSFTTVALPAGARYTYQVQAADAADLRGPMSDPSAEVDGLLAPGQVSGVSVVLNP